MSKINPPTITVDDFVQNQFTPSNRDVIFWDTCSLLDILRLPYRNGDLSAFNGLLKIKDLIDNDNIFSVCSSLTIAEWNEHEEKTKQDTDKNLLLTSNFHKNSIDIINRIFTTTHPTSALHDKGLVNELEDMSTQILNKTFFLETDEIADSALWRVANKRPPASKKREFKDCAIWESVLALGSQIYSSGKKIVYFTVNTDDYLDKSRTPHQPHGNIISEATTKGVTLTLNFEDAASEL